MYRITIISVGWLKESYWREAANEYLKRLRPYVRINLREIADEPFKSEADKKRVLSREADRIGAAIPQDSTVIVLDVTGKEMTSPKFASILDNLGGRGEHLCFVIGGPLGIGDAIRARAKLRLSFSPLTFTHQIARILLFEQLYRALTIIHNKPYHY